MKNTHYTPHLLPDQKSPEAQHKFINELMQSQDGRFSTGDVLKFALKYGFMLENAFKAIQSAIDYDLINADRFEDEVLFITHRQTFLTGRDAEKTALFNEKVEAEILRLEQEYQKANPLNFDTNEKIAEAKLTISQDAPTGNSKIRPRPRMRP